MAVTSGSLPSGLSCSGTSKGGSLGEIAVLIPAYNPPESLVGLVRDLTAVFPRIIVVDDGSAKEYGPTFTELKIMEGVTLLRHGINLGKGAALKTGLNHIYCYYSDVMGVITVDADGQHLRKDVFTVADLLKENPDALIIGARNFGRDVPFRSRLGNILTRHLFKNLIGLKLADTQSGLRGVPASFIPVLLGIGANRYEFELDMLLACKYTSRRIVEHPISTVYSERNNTSHFNPVIDSMKIYFVLLRFTFASLLSAAIDNVVFIIIYGLSSNILFSQVCARAVSMVFNYSAVRKTVFYSDIEHARAFPKYLSLVIISGFVSYLLIKAATTASSMPVVAAKIAAESLIFFLNFAVQRDFIFVRNGRG